MNCSSPVKRRNDQNKHGARGVGRPLLAPPYQGGEDSEGEALRADERREARGEGEKPIVSLRRIAPPGFLTQTFAVDSSGCAS